MNDRADVKQSKTSKQRTNTRYAQWKLEAPNLTECPQCHELKASHRVCPKCGYSFDEEIYSIVRSNYNIQNEDYMYKQIEQIISSIASELEQYKENYVSLMEELKQQEQAYDKKQDSYGASI